jgi:hypothetical protein
MKRCPECGHAFRGNGWDGIDAHWRARHERTMPYEEAWPHIEASTYWQHKGKLLDEWLAQYTKDVEEWREQHRDEENY